jgi:hypothetical protein
MEPVGALTGRARGRAEIKGVLGNIAGDRARDGWITIA